MELTLYHHNNSVCSEKVRMVLNEKGITDWKSVELDILKGDQFDPDYLKLNSKAVVPTLIHDGNILTESTLISEYLDDAFSGPPLKPDTPLEQAQMRLYSKACDEGLHQGVGVLSFSAMFMDRLQSLSTEDVDKRLNRIIDLDRRDRMKSVFTDGAGSPYVYRGTAAYEKIFQKIEHELSDGRDWLMGDRFTLAEINLAPYLTRLENMNLLDIWTEGRPKASAWFNRVKARRSFQVEIVDWIEEYEWAEMRDGGNKIKALVRDYKNSYIQSDPAAAYY